MDQLENRMHGTREELEKLARDDAFSGVVHVRRGADVLLASAHGTASRRWGVPVHPGMRFDVASVTKLFTSVAVLQQVDAGALELDGSIHDYVDLAGTTISPAVTLRHLLSHTSGIADDADEEAGESYEAIWLERTSYLVTETADFLPQFVHKPPVFAPGEGCRYCNVGYILLGLALERVTGRRYREVVVGDVFGRAGMTDSGFFHMRDAVPDVAEGWDPVRAPSADSPDEDPADGPITGWRLNIYSYPPIGSPDGGAHVTASDLVRFFDAVRGGRLLSPASTEAFLTPQALHHTVDDADPGETAAVHHAFGLEIEVTSDGEVRSLYKDGINAGASAIVRHYPAQDVTLAVVANSEDGAWEPIRLLDAAVVGSG